MQLREKLLANYPDLKVEFDSDMPENFGGLFIKDEIAPFGNIIINGKANYYVQNCILAEELGHLETTTENILNAYSKEYNVNSAKQELTARRYGYRLILPLERLIECYELGIWGDVYEMCTHLEIDYLSFQKIINDYKIKFGSYVKYEGYFIKFEPLEIEKLSS